MIGIDRPIKQWIIIESGVDGGSIGILNLLAMLDFRNLLTSCWCLHFYFSWKTLDQMMEPMSFNQNVVIRMSMLIASARQKWFAIYQNVFYIINASCNLVQRW